MTIIRKDVYVDEFSRIGHDEVEYGSRRKLGRPRRINKRNTHLCIP
jgi:hypothetical protein